MDIYSDIARKIIEQQESVIGPIASQQAQQIQGLNLDWSNHTVNIIGDPKTAIDALISRYKELFGQIAVEVSKDAVSSIASALPPSDLPELLR